MAAWATGPEALTGGWTVLHAGAVGGSPWEWHPHPDVWLLVAAIGMGYAAAIRFLGPRLAARGENAAPRGKMALFYLGLAVLWVGADWPVHDLSEGYLYSVHMVQHMLFSLIAPPLMLLGTPAWLLRPLIRPRWALHTARVLVHPVTALLLFNGVTVVTHLPPVVDLTLRSEAAHFAAHAALAGSAFIMWWPVLSPLPELPALPYLGRLAFLFAQSIVPTVPASFLTFADGPIYGFYETVPRLWDISAGTDQQVAGLIMKLGGGLILWAVIAVLFFKWWAQEEAKEPRPPEWEEVELELERMGLSKR